MTVQIDRVIAGTCCPQCEGRRALFNEPCLTCNGKGWIEVQVTIAELAHALKREGSK